jgi:hypothetical protein
MKIPDVQVGLDAETDGPVYACADPCAGHIADDAERMAREMREAAAEMGAGTGPEEHDHAPDDGGLLDDGHFGHLLINLRALVGTEALLTVADDVPSVRYLLGLTARHAEAAMLRSRLILARTALDDGEGG